MRKFLVIAFILLASCLNLYLAQPSYAQFSDSPSQQQTQRSQVSLSNPFESLVSIVHSLFALAFLVSLLVIIIATVQFIIAGGNETVIASAQSLWTMALVGLGVSLLGYVIINVIRYYLR